jgi:hypothetical protein
LDQGGSHESWTVEDGLLHGKGLTKAYGYLETEPRTTKTFQLSLRFKCVGDGNSGVFFHTGFKPDSVDTTQGMQFEIDCTMMHHTAGVYGEDGRGWVVWPSPENEGVVRMGEWNDYLVEVVGNRYRSRLNGVQMVDFTDPKPELLRRQARPAASCGRQGQHAVQGYLDTRPLRPLGESDRRRLGEANAPPRISSSCTLYAVLSAGPLARAFPALPRPRRWRLGWSSKPQGDPQPAIARVKEFGMSDLLLVARCLHWKIQPRSLAQQMQDALHEFGITPTAAEVVGPGKLVWDFKSGPSTIGVVPPATRVERIDALKQTSDFARLLRGSEHSDALRVHSGESGRSALRRKPCSPFASSPSTARAIMQSFLMETGQETPTTVMRTIKDVDRPNLGVGLDTANLILYGKANPVDAVDILGPRMSEACTPRTADGH